MTKNEILQTLNEIKKSGVDVSKSMRREIMNEDIQNETLIFINKYKPLDELFTYNKIYEKRRNNPLFKNLVNEDLNVEEKAIALSSFQTQALIRTKELIKENKTKEAKRYCQIMQVENIAKALSAYANGDTSLVESMSVEIRECFKKLFY